MQLLRINTGDIDWDLYTGELKISNATLGENVTIKSGILRAQDSPPYVYKGVTGNERNQ